ncbi:DinB family protein [Haliscomenobacter hydrossis DSM 1100]|uniref:DinB family protein n=2 Tax=Haliscomenobacter TaxID=2349 RepID=F4KX66_HALH1|nr:DinB family protein [Haliscomenobacter hydrossis DSM 1100]
MITLAALLLLTLTVHAQMADSIKVQFVRDWQRAKAYTKEYLDAMPKDKYNYRAHDSIRTFGQQMLHLAQANAGLVANGTAANRIWMGKNLEQIPSIQSADSVAHYVLTSYDYAITSISNMNPAILNERVKRGPFDISRYAWILKAFEHQTHHRGQTTIYIRLLGIKPPNEKLF